MPVAGLVVTLTELDLVREEAVASLGSDGRITLGELQRGGRLPVVLSTDSVLEEQALMGDVARTPGVLLVDLAFHDFSDVGEFSSDELPQRRRTRE